MAVLTPQKPGAAVVYSTAAAGGDEYANSGRELVHVRNAGGSACNVTFNSQKACDQGFDHDETVTVAAGSDELIAAKSASRFNDANGHVLITYDQVANVTIAILSPS